MIPAALLLAALVAADPAAETDDRTPVGPFLEKHVWPISGSQRPDLPLNSTFGPRLLASENLRYDFHRGVDIQAAEGTPVHAIAEGTVRIAGKHTAYKDPLVQVAHKKPDGSGNYYSNYMHLSQVDVKEGDQVEAGQVVGRSGLSENQFPHLHFEIRDGGAFQMYCIHPLAVLPYENNEAPRIKINRVLTTDKKRTIVALTVTTSTDEPDLNRVEVEVYDRSELVGRQVFDMIDWNRRYTPREKPTEILDQDYVHGVELAPDRFRASSDRYSLDLKFDELPPVPLRPRLLVKARAIDVLGNSSEATFK